MLEDKMTNLTDVTIILDNSQLKQDDKPRAEDVEKLSTKTDSSKPLEANHDEAKTGKEAMDSSLLLDITTTTTDETLLNQPTKDIERDSTKPNSAKPSENNLRDVVNIQKCEETTPTFSSSTGEKSEMSKDTARSRPISSNLKEKGPNENIKELSVEKPVDPKAKANVEGDANMGGGKGETMREVFDILDESKSGHISPLSFGHLIRSLGDFLTSKSVSNVQYNYV